jgi:membrane associated rhomboid family serine protease
MTTNLPYYWPAAVMVVLVYAAFCLIGGAAFHLSTSAALVGLIIAGLAALVLICLDAPEGARQPAYVRAPADRQNT